MHRPRPECWAGLFGPATNDCRTSGVDRLGDVLVGYRLFATVSGPRPGRSWSRRRCAWRRDPARRAGAARPRRRPLPGGPMSRTTIYATLAGWAVRMFGRLCKSSVGQAFSGARERFEKTARSTVVAGWYCLALGLGFLFLGFVTGTVGDDWAFPSVFLVMGAISAIAGVVIVRVGK